MQDTATPAEMRSNIKAWWLLAIAIICYYIYIYSIQLLLGSGLLSTDHPQSKGKYRAVEKRGAARAHTFIYPDVGRAVQALAEVPPKNRSSDSIAGINRTEPLGPHPHAGARDADGNYGYVTDTTKVRHWMKHRYETFRNEHLFNESISASQLPSPTQYQPFGDNGEFESVCNTPPGKGPEGEAGLELMMDHILVENNGNEDLFEAQGQTTRGSPADESSTGSSVSQWFRTKLRDAADRSSEGLNSGANIDRSVTKKESKQQPPPPSKGKILCIVYTYAGKHPQVQSIAETWGWRCDGFFAASTKTVTNTTHDLGYGAIDLPHMGGESYGTMWQKTRSIIGYVYDNYLNEYDYFLNCGDDTYILVDNMRGYLGEVEHRQRLANGTMDAVLLGHHIQWGKRQPMYVGGGPGYVYNRAALKLFVEGNIQTCRAHELKSSEDRFISNCMQALGVTLADTADAEGRQRFVGLDINWHAKENPWATKSWLLGLYQYWANEGNPPHGKRWGRNITSTQLVSLHNMKQKLHMRRINAIFYNACPLDTALGDFLAKAA